MGGMITDFQANTSPTNSQDATPRIMPNALAGSLMTVEALGEAEDHVLLSGITDDGDPLTQDVCDRLLSLDGRQGRAVMPDADAMARLERSLSESGALIRRLAAQRDARFFEAEADKRDRWADDLKVGLEREIKEIDRLIKETRRIATAALTLEQKLANQRQIRTLEATRNHKRRSLFDAQDQIDTQRANLIADIEANLEQKVEVAQLFVVRWSLE